MTTALQVGALVAEGRLATVHRATLRGRAVAVKRANGAPGAAAALRREGRVLAAATHPAIVPVLEVFEDATAPALVLGWADGGSLADLLADGPLPDVDLLQLLRPLAGGLAAMHHAGVAHLDVTIENVLLAAVGPVLVDPAPPGAGTPGYADPVVAAGGPASARSDVFGLAACAHVALTGRRPRATGGVAVGVSLPPAVLAALAAGLHPEPRFRPPSPPVFVDLLQAALPHARPPMRTVPATVRGRPVARTLRRTPGPARTWPFDRWHEAAADAQQRRLALAATIAPRPAPDLRRRRRATVGLALVTVFALVTAVTYRSIERRSPPSPVRSSASDSTQRPPATRPPPTATPGGNP